jgi:uncharacterized membrane protein (UPF0127 family)
MTEKTKIVWFSAIAGAVVVAVLLNWVSNEVFSLRHLNSVKRIFVKDVPVKVERVSSKKKIERGLAGRSGLAEGRGMLFVMPDDEIQHFWMKGMEFPIDIIWIEDGRVIGCEKRVSPKDQRTFASPGNASFVLETVSGFCDLHDIQSNDSVRM